MPEKRKESHKAQGESHYYIRHKFEIGTARSSSPGKGLDGHSGCGYDSVIAVHSIMFCAMVSTAAPSFQSNISTVRATSPAFIARNASLTSVSRPRWLTISSSISRPCR